MPMSRWAFYALARTLTGLLLVVGSVTTWAAEPELAQKWLERMAESVNGLSYRGTFVYQHEGRLETMRLIRRTHGDDQRERLYALSGPAREIIRDNEKVTCYLPSDGAVRVDWQQSSNPFADVLPDDIALLTVHYRFELQGRERIAEREAQVVAVLPRDSFRYGYRLWMDVEHGLLLRSDLLNEQGDVLEQLVFTELEVVDNVPEQWLRPEIEADMIISFERPDPRELQAEPHEEPTWTVADLPPGFGLRSYRLRNLPGSSNPVEHLLYSDGLASVSVYIESERAERAFAGGSRVGVVNAFGHWEDGLQFIVVGEVPANTVTQIGRSLEPVASE